MTIIHLVCLTSSGGLPILNRKFGDTDNLPFSTVGSLNGVLMFCKSHGVQLNTTYLPDNGLVVWREFEQCITIIVSAHGVPENVIADLMELVFGSLVLAIGLESLKTVQNANQFKREIKSIYPMVDNMLAGVTEDLLRFSECVLSAEASQHLERLNEFSERVGSPFCCLLVQDKILAGTEGWWDLDAVDRKLLLQTLKAPDAQLKNPADRPVFLPRKSPSVAFRFCVVSVWQNVRVGVVCGSEPRFEEIERLAHLAWSRTENCLLDTAEECCEFSVPKTLVFVDDIAGFILLNRVTSKFVVWNKNASESLPNRSSTSTVGHRIDVLRTFFHQSVDAKRVGLTLRNEDRDANGSWTNPEASETYWCADYHKCHAFAFEEYVLCVLYAVAIPTHTMRLITQRTLNGILSEKGILW